MNIDNRWFLVVLAVVLALLVYSNVGQSPEVLGQLQIFSDLILLEQDATPSEPPNATSGGAGIMPMPRVVP